MNDLPERIDPNVVPRWVSESYPGMEEEIENWLISYYFYKEWDGKLESLRSANDKARAVAHAKYKTLSQTGSLKRASEQSELIQLYEAQKTGWFSYIDEIDDVKELLNHIMEEEQEKNSHRVYNLSFIIKTLIPALEKMGVAKELILKIPQNMSKADWAVPTLRKIIDNNGPQMQQNMETVLKSIVDPSISAVTMRDDIIPGIMGSESSKTPPALVANVCMLPNNRELVIISSDPAHTKAIRMSTKNIISGFGYTDPVHLLREFGDIVKPKAGQKRRYRRDSFGELKVNSQEGVYLTDPAAIRDIVIQKYFDHRFYIRKPGVQQLIIEELSFSYSPEVFSAALGFDNDEDAYIAIEKLYRPALENLEKNIPTEDHIRYELVVDKVETSPGHIGVFSFLAIEFQGL